MSGPREAWEPAEGEGADSAPAPSAPPASGTADPVAEAPAAPRAQPEARPQARPEGAAANESEAAPEPIAKPASEAASEAGSEAGSDTAGAAPVPGEIRLPIGLQKPWWAADSEPDSDAGSEPGPDAADSGSTPAADATATGTGTGTGTEQTVVGAQEADETSGQAEHTATAPLPGAPPGTLVAGHGVPKVDTRGAVPSQPIVPINGPQYPDTDPDGIPVISPEEAAAAAAAEASAAAARSPAAPKPGPPEPEPRTGEDAAAPAPSGSAPQPRRSDRPSAAPVPPVPPVAAATPPSGTPTVGTGGPDPADRPTAEQPAVDQPTAEQPAVAAPAPPETAFSSGPLSAGPGTAGRGGGRRRKALLVGGGVIAVALVAAAGLALVGSGGESEGRRAKAVATPGAKDGPVPSASPSTPGATASPSPSGGASRIDSARTDPKPLALAEAFPSNRVDLGGRTYARDRSSVNHQCALTARGAMARALTRLRCGSVVRVTFLDKERSLAITSGVAVFPGKDAALKANDAGDPARYEWFRALPGPRTKDIDRAGGYAASTVRGRYIAYAYATYAGGKKPRPGDPTLKEVAEQFVAYALRPIDARARA